MCSITIVTPTYNRALLVQTTINSILNQTYKDWELIIVDDGSTDDTEQAIQPFLKDTRIHYLKKANTGQAHSLNVGVSKANGQFITFLDSDDEAYPHWLEVASSMMKEDTGIICMGAVRKYLNGQLVREGLKEYKLFGKVMRLKFTCGSLFIRRTVFDAVGGYDTMLKCNTQTDLGYRLLEYLQSADLQVVTSEDCLVQINIHDGARIRTNWQKTRDGGIQFINKHYDFIRGNDPKEISNIYASIAFSSYKMKDRAESIRFLVKAIRHNPARWINYMRILKYALT